MITVLDVTLNILFIRLVKGRLVDHGLTKYNKVMKWVSRYPWFTLFVDFPKIQPAYHRYIGRDGYSLARSDWTAKPFRVHSGGF